MGSPRRRQLKAMLRKNWLLKIRHPFTTCAEILLPAVVMLILIGIRSRSDTTIHSVDAYIRKGMFVEVGKSEISPSFDSILKSLFSKGEHLAFAPDTKETQMMLHVLSLRFPLIKVVGKIYKDELELESYIKSELYGTYDQVRNLSYPKIKGAIVFHEQGPQTFDYSIRLNHTWAFSGFPDVKSIMDVNGPYLNDLELGVNIVPTLQYGFSGFLTLQQTMDSLLILLSQQTGSDTAPENLAESMSDSFGYQSNIDSKWTQFIPENVRIAPFPTREYTDDEFQSIAKRVMGVLYLLGFLYPVSRLISYSVFEKEQKIREGLHMMGLKDDIFYLSWFLTYLFQFAVSSAITTACTMSSLFKYSDKTLVFAYFFLFGLSAVMLCFLISTFFSRAKTAVAVGTLSFLGSFFPYYTVNDPSVPMIWKILASLLSPTAFALGTVNFADYERAHVGVRWSNIWQGSSGVNFLLCLLMMILDMALYCAMWLYFDKVLPRESGLRYPWNFLIAKLWQRKDSFEHIDNPDGKPTQAFAYNATEDIYNPAIEATNFDMKQLEVDKRCIQIRNLGKVYMTKKKCSAVNSLELTLYENQILALLGHNGAGKSTTISMLVGLLSPTYGDAFIFGKNIMTDMDDIRKMLGVCPQYDILFPELTVKEHLEIFALLKDVDEDCLEMEVLQMIDEVGLADKINANVAALSGGMKRKLSLGIALIGNSKVVILDEPTSGMDPYSMRSTWKLLKKKKKGRIILLTTHSMDEADVLGDRIAIMANGHLRCCGSSLFLKHRYGVGYTLTISKTNPGASVAADIIHRHVPSATCLTDVGTEISFRLPLSSSTSFEHMFREIEDYIKRPSMNHISKSSHCEDMYAIESYGISVTTLEEVFLRVSGENYGQNDVIGYDISRAISTDVVTESSYAKLLKSSKWKMLMWVYHNVCRWVIEMGKLFYLVCATICGFIESFILKFCCGNIVVSSTFWKHFKALLVKRVLSSRRDRRTIIFQLLIPAIFLLLGLLLLRLRPHPDQYSVTLTTSHFNPLLGGGGGGGPIPFNLSFPIAKKVASYVQGGWIQEPLPRSYHFPDSETKLEEAIDAAGPQLGPSLLSMSEFLITSLNESWQSRYGAIVMDDQNNDGSVGYTVLHNSSCQHSAPTYINLVNAAILRMAIGNENVTIQTHNHPLPRTMSQWTQRHDLDAFSASIIINIAFSFIPASFAVAIVKEREVKAKHQQLISGVSILSYWISTYVWDFVSFLFPTSLAMGLFFIFDLSQFIGNGCLLPTIIIFLEYGLAVAASTYCLTFFFFDHSVAQNVVLLFHFFSGLVLMVISFLLGLIDSTKDANSLLKNFFRISPGFCFADALASLALRRQDMKRGSGSDPTDWNVTGASICYLALESVIYFLCTIVLEILSPQKLSMGMMLEWLKNFLSHQHDVSKSHYQPLLGPHDDTSTLDEDIDVKAERHRVLSGNVDNALIYLYNLRKIYPSERNRMAKVAVHSLSFAVQEGECFGFLGTNGAGKTTTLSMLTGEESPTDGTAYIFGNDIRMHPRAARQHIGYCPQFDALMEFLTAREHLELYAKIKGVPDGSIDEVVNEKLVEFDLLKHADKPSFSLSGGNKRKLSVAIAMIGNPPIVILDEPSTGMDPLAKRFMWDVISRLSTRQGKTAVILTTHSMNEAQALCTRIGIMVGGQLRCLGSPQYLKTRFGDHLELEVKPSIVSSIELENLCRTIQEILFDFPNHTRSILADIEVCIGVDGILTSENASELCLTKEMIVLVARVLGNEESIEPIISSLPTRDGLFLEQLSEQLLRDGGIPLRIFAEWWLAKEKFVLIDSFILSSFPGSTFHGSSGLSIKYQLPYGEGSSLADIFGLLEHNREKLGIEEYSISQSTLETIFNHFAATQ